MQPWRMEPRRMGMARKKSNQRVDGSGRNFWNLRRDHFCFVMCHCVRVIISFFPFFLSFFFFFLLVLTLRAHAYAWIRITELLIYIYIYFLCVFFFSWSGCRGVRLFLLCNGMKMLCFGMFCLFFGNYFSATQPQPQAVRRARGRSPSAVVRVLLLLFIFLVYVLCFFFMVWAIVGSVPILPARLLTAVESSIIFWRLLQSVWTNFARFFFFTSLHRPTCCPRPKACRWWISHNFVVVYQIAVLW